MSFSRRRSKDTSAPAYFESRNMYLTLISRWIKETGRPFLVVALCKHRQCKPASPFIFFAHGLRWSPSSSLLLHSNSHSCYATENRKLPFHGFDMCLYYLFSKNFKFNTRRSLRQYVLIAHLWPGPKLLMVPHPKCSQHAHFASRSAICISAPSPVDSAIDFLYKQADIIKLHWFILIIKSVLNLMYHSNY